MNKNDLEKLIKPYLDKQNLILCDIEERHEFGSRILSFVVDNEIGKITIDELAQANNHISDLLDTIDIEIENYLLEVTSPGVEKPLRSYDAVKASIGEYVCVTLEKEELIGDLIDCSDNELTIRVNHKGRFKNHKIHYEDVVHIRLAVKM